jgi:hypothetical protein
MMRDDESGGMTIIASAAEASRGRRFLGLTLLLAGNAILLGLAEWSLSFWLPLDGTTATFNGMRLLSNLYDGIVVAQVLLLGFWCALAPERLLVRLIAGLLLVGLLLAEIYGLYFWLVSHHLTQEVNATDAGRYLGLALLTFLLLRVVRPWCRWRLAWIESQLPAQSRQFRIIDLMTWTTAVAVPLGLLQTFYGSQAVMVVLLTTFTFLQSLPVTLPTFRWAVHPARKPRWLLALLVWGVAWPGLMMVTNGGYIVFANSRWAALGFHWREVLFLFAVSTAYYVPLVLVPVVNLSLLAKIGLRPASVAWTANPRRA